MNKLLKKEMTLSASPLTYFFIAFGLLTVCPGYPILVGGFFVCMGLFNSFQAAREANDPLYTALLPVAKSDVVKAKYLFCVVIELCGFAVSAAITLLRMTVLSEAAAYRANALMNANPAYLGFLLTLFGLFNVVFVGGYFKTAYRLAGPFIRFAIVTFVFVAAAETLHHLPGCGAINAFGFDAPALQLSVLAAGALAYALLTLTSMKRAQRRFEQVDL